MRVAGYIRPRVTRGGHLFRDRGRGEACGPWLGAEEEQLGHCVLTAPLLHVTLFVEATAFHVGSCDNYKGRRISFSRKICYFVSPSKKLFSSLQHVTV